MPAAKKPTALKQLIARWVRWFRADRQVSQEELAAHLHFSPRQIQKIESGVSTPSVVFISTFTAAMKEEKRQEFYSEFTAVTARERGVKPIRREDTNV